jgi:glycosyltransferase involved in cell wall biosynthesis
LKNKLKTFKHNPKSKVAIGHPRLMWGGSEKRVWWGIEALKNDYDVTLVTAGEFNLEEMNRYYGTSLRPTDFKVRQAPLPFFLRKNAKAAALRGALYQRFCRSIANEYDVLISAYGPCDFGVPAIHFIADFSWDKEIREKYDPYPPSFIYRDDLLRKCYLWIARHLRTPSGRNLFSGEDKIIAVSPWVAKLMKEKYSIECQVIYSPILGDFPPASYQSKEIGFVCLGRIAPEKRIERIIEILAKVRQTGYNLHLHIIGGADESSYSDKVNKLCSKNSEWVIQEGRLFGKNKVDLLLKHLFGIHARQAEPFPGAVIEMMKAGCIVFVPNEGGQIEVVNHPALIYNNVDDAVSKIERVLNDNAFQIELQKHLAKQAEKFSTERFMKEIREVVQHFFKENKR